MLIAAQALFIAVVLQSMHNALLVGAMSPSGRQQGARLFIPTLNPDGDQSTNLTSFFFLICAIAALTSLGATSPLYSRQHAMYIPFSFSQLIKRFDASKPLQLISDTEIDSWLAFFPLTIGA
uniref:Uncharacterized protein n=1 Tax=Panstrongylus lignarius TaxID=156445 RepID=A0A224Y0E5_9HEMI